jgi:hypothetical protein
MGFLSEAVTWLLAQPYGRDMNSVAVMMALIGGLWLWIAA